MTDFKVTPRVLTYSWLFWVERSFYIVFQSMLGRLEENGRKKREMTNKQKYPNKHHLHLPSVGVCPIFVKIIGHSDIESSHPHNHFRNEIATVTAGLKNSDISDISLIN